MASNDANNLEPSGVEARLSDFLRQAAAAHAVDLIKSGPVGSCRHASVVIERISRRPQTASDPEVEPGEEES